MTKLFLLSLVSVTCLSFIPVKSSADTQWISEADICTKKMKKEPGCMPLVTSKGIGVKWIGEIIQVEIDVKSNGTAVMTGQVRVRITWDSKHTSYRCSDDPRQFNIKEDLKDVTKRSLSLRRCK